MASREQEMMKTPAFERMNRFVQRGPDCWLWTGAKNRDGNGVIWDGGAVGAHVVAYVKAFGPVPAGARVVHTCRNPSCVNPQHLKAS